ncbi:uncharacterized protein LOC114180631 [Vigna unguiculata]|uniref:uncharacterized protein LOC114180631 n=1 Tax=Vigna unguiculata TaxID=3917 RepID=UPI00101640AB|nr:uncharacterized protein LOC114180631 [Vigna unguiculata]
MRATQSRQKSYADKRRRPLEFEEGDHVFLRVTPILRKYITDPTYMLEEDDVQVREDPTIGVGPVRILDSQVKQLRGKEIRTVKVLWDKATQEMTWEMEDVMRRSYPHLFPDDVDAYGLGKA